MERLRKVMGLILTAVKAVLAAIFGSLWGRLFPAKTAADQKADDLGAALAAKERMADAAAKAPMTDDEVHDILRNGRL